MTSSPNESDRPGEPPAVPHQPFAARLREPWLNPAKRTSLVLAAVVAAIVLFGGGIVIGAVALQHHSRVHVVRLVPFEREPAGYGLPGFRARHRHRLPGRLPRGRVLRPNQPAPRPTAPPTSTHS